MNERTKELTNLNLGGVKNLSTKEEHFSLASLVRMLLSNFRDKNPIMRHISVKIGLII